MVATEHGKRGRKELGQYKRRGKELTLSPAAWRWLDWYTRYAGLGTVSQAVEIIVRTHRDYQDGPEVGSAV